MALKQRTLLPDSEKDTLLYELDKGIDDLEAGRTMPHEEAMKKIQERISVYAVSYR